MIPRCPQHVRRFGRFFWALRVVVVVSTSRALLCTLLHPTTNTQRELKQSAKRLEKAEGFASNLEAELHRAAGDGVSFEMFVVLKRDNQALKTQLAEIKQVSEKGV